MNACWVLKGPWWLEVASLKTGPRPIDTGDMAEGFNFYCSLGTAELLSGSNEASPPGPQQTFPILTASEIQIPLS